MRRYLFILLSSIAVADIVLGADFKFDCPENVINSLPPIVNTTQYSYSATVTVASKNMSIEAYEVYDMSNGTVKLYVHYPDQKNSSIWISEWIHHDFNYNQTFAIDPDAETCVVSELDHNKLYSIFGQGIEDGFQNPEFSYIWTGDYNYTLENSTVVNGIDADKYSTCLLFNNSQLKYDVDLYFSADGWTTRTGENVPLMVVLQVNRTLDEGKTFQSETYTYTFSSFQRNAWVSWASGTSDTPPDIICPGRKDALPAPLVASSYSDDEVVYIAESKTMMSFRRFYNYDDKLFRTDAVPVGNSSSYKIPGHHYTIVHDFHEGVEYVIDRDMGSCTIQPVKLVKFSFDIENDPTHKGFLRMRNVPEWQKERNYTYTGRHHHKGITLDSWTSTVPFTRNTTTGRIEIRVTMLYLTPDWSSSDGVSPVPHGSVITIRNTTNGTTRTTKRMIQVSRATNRMNGIHMFDVGTCYNKETSRSFVLMFDGSYGDYIDQNSEVMNVAIQAAVAKAANVSKIRVSSWSGKELGPDASKGNANPKLELFVTVYLYGHPRVHGNTTEFTPSINLTTAAANLKAAVKENKLIVEFTPYEGTVVSMVAYYDYFKEQSSLYSPAPPDSPSPPGPAPPSPSSGAAGLSSGGIAGLCVAMLVLGLIAGALLIHIRYKRGNRQFGYSIQD